MLLPEHVLGLHMGPQYRKKSVRAGASSSSLTESLKYDGNNRFFSVVNVTFSEIV